MGKKNEITPAYIIDLYMDTVVSLGGKPESIERFSKSNGFDEDQFLEHFEDFEDLDQEIIKILFDTSLATLAESGDYRSFTKKDKLLSLYYTFFENLSLNRAFILITIKSYGNLFNTINVFKTLKSSFTSFIDSLKLDTISLNIEPLENIQKKSIKETAWVQLLLTIKFWTADESEGGERTDVFIEKSINTSVELLNTQSLHNIIDLGKFLYSEKFKS
jgi:hypothetical protein